MVESYRISTPEKWRECSFKRLGTQRLTKAEEANNSTRKLPTLPQRLARAHHISRSTLKIFRTDLSLVISEQKKAIVAPQ